VNKPVTTETNSDIVARRAQERWLRTRAAGRSSFVWRYGVIGWGLPAGLFAAGYHILRLRAASPNPGPLSLAALRPQWESLAGLIIVSCVVGYLLGAWLWDFCESRFTT
jgi:hypothetical protein